MTRPVHIVAARRTPIGRFIGGLAELSSSALGAIAVRQVLADSAVDPATIDEVIIGQVLTAGAGMNPARQAAIGGGLPIHVPAFTVNKVCGSGLKAIHLGTQAIAAGDAELILAGGQESMTQAPHLLAGRRASKLGDVTATDSIMVDGLVDAFNHVAMGITAEGLATKFGLSREAQDGFALASHQKAVAAAAAGRFAAEIAPVTVTERREQRLVVADEQPRADTTLAALARLKPAFEQAGTVTAGNAASLNDGAAAVLLASEARAIELGLTSLGRIVSTASAALEPMEMGLGAATAAQRALDRAGWHSSDVDLIELNEAFAAQALAVMAAMHWAPERVNVNGGAIALGHPIGASGCRVVVTLLHEMQRRNVRRGLATLCIGGGQGVAVCIER
ncbi:MULTISPECIES: acetyl-CoA C-acetyltransferase [unclassified Devosia]|uniref:acetyl-CoA C-acetyltransferase n=1 Tax=unclassified Devosia TaxID=196773 RepID=UPI000869A8C0|nr:MULTISPECIES: acetyl-CoA C-acetyltransferase [unclassified Devosia]MBN9363542.1 acetyl-CoA C-acetyltransferase [Devosia sp.]ODS86280.1 MAG: acetyl-CoA acetyltransferase [Devosia sp. SCN 66-27]OJX25353.1 MAG: acetyl-CoA acetyltransferase [Devosia sp. 66-14]